MATSDVNTIVLKGNGHHDEGEAGVGTIIPGMAIELQADGKYDPVVTAQAAALKAGLKIAKEDALQGKLITDTYTLADRVFFYSPQEGDHIFALVKSGEDIDVGNKLLVEGGTSGLFVEAAAQTKFQLEALEDSGGVLAANTHLRMRVVAP